MSSPDEFQCAGSQGIGWAFGCSRTGAAHRKSGRPCEDAFALWSGSSGSIPYIAFALADGHGDPRHDQSRTGAALAVQSAVEELVTFHSLHLYDTPQHALRAEFRVDFPRRVSRRWRESVTEDAERREDQIAIAGTGFSLFTRYGSTLIAASVVANTILLGQIGDGDAILVRPDGTIETPLPGDPTLIGTETRSLSSRDAHLLWRTATLDRGSGGVLIAATDGISDSFDGSEGPEFMKFIRSIVNRIEQYGIEDVAGAMSGWLDRYSELASGDDMTLVFVCINAAEPPVGKRADLPSGDDAGPAWGF
jgi:serine/threonine protein phosphatase PrpC